MAMRKVDHPLCEQGFVVSNAGNFSRLFVDKAQQDWIGRTKNPPGWQPRCYFHWAGDGQPTEWLGPVVADAWTAYAIGELANWGR